MRRFVTLALWLFSGGASASAQDLFEIEVLPHETTAAGETSIDLHTNGIPGSASLATITTTDHPFHASVELSHGWTDHYETGVFLQTAPVARPHGVRFAGGHIRPKFRFPSTRRVPFAVSLAVEYGINRTVFDENRQTLEIVPIVERRAGRLLLSLNPEWSVTIRGPETPSVPKVSAAGKAAWQATPHVSAGVEYYWKTEALKHFDPVVDRHHFAMPVVDIDLSPEWELNVGAGHCLTASRERWVLKSIVGYRFH